MQVIRQRAEELRDFSANTLSQIVKIRSFSGKEKEVCQKIVEICEEIGMDEIRIDKLGSVVARLGSGKKSIAFDAHIDTVETFGDLSASGNGIP
jgi:putative aminopeptidase FrvX